MFDAMLRGATTIPILVGMLAPAGVLSAADPASAAVAAPVGASILVGAAATQSLGGASSAEVTSSLGSPYPGLRRACHTFRTAQPAETDS